MSFPKNDMVTLTTAMIVVTADILTRHNKQVVAVVSVVEQTTTSTAEADSGVTVSVVVFH